jgi:hypothetical protein
VRAERGPTSPGTHCGAGGSSPASSDAPGRWSRPGSCSQDRAGPATAARSSRVISTRSTSLSRSWSRRWREHWVVTGPRGWSSLQVKEVPAKVLLDVAERMRGCSWRVAAGTVASRARCLGRSARRVPNMPSVPSWRSTGTTGRRPVDVACRCGPGPRSPCPGTLSRADWRRSSLEPRSATDQGGS